MKKFIISSILLIAVVGLLYSCSSTRNMTAQNFKEYRWPAGVYEIDSNLYYDEAEITNFYWLEYMYWTNKIFGPESDEYKAILIDSTCWTKLDSCLVQFDYYYLRSPAYRDYPLVGVSHKQAEGYSQWRSDRVFEFILVATNIIDVNPNQNRESHFTIENYFSGKYLGLKPDFSIPYPQYSLPNSFQRNQALKVTDSLRSTRKVPRKFEEGYSSQYGSIRSNEKLVPDSCDFYPRGVYTPVSLDFTKKYTKEIIDHLRGNVCEWSSDPSYCYGGARHHTLDEILENDNFLVSDAANTWVGFRNVCQWKMWKEE